MNIEKKFIGVKTVNNIEVKTDIGYIPIKNIMKTIEYQVYEVLFDNAAFIECADTHILINSNNEEVFVKDLKVNDVIKSSNGTVKVKCVTDLGYSVNMFDLQLEYHHKFYTNDILSHNTTVSAGYICHQTVFNEDYRTAILANKGATAREVLSRVCMMYEELPWYLQMGVKTWNKGNIELGNGSSVITAGTSSSSIRGKSINCVKKKDSYITVRNKRTGEIKELLIDDFEKLLRN